ncbi:MAG: guanylate cyclase [Cytophagaceae bacterium]|nr:MAG: guanylate cyclase [Cytophagaceae bacterium]
MTKSRLDAFSVALSEEGLAGSIAVLNANVGHRYTAVYRLEKAVLYDHALFDKLGKVRPAHLASVPLGVSFCQFVFKDGSFDTSDSAKDSRLNGHPYQRVVVSYTGVPITEHFGKGEIIGSLCHLDLGKQHLASDEFDLLQQAARRITAPMMKS